MAQNSIVRLGLSVCCVQSFFFFFFLLFPVPNSPIVSRAVLLGSRAFVLMAEQAAQVPLLSPYPIVKAFLP